MSDNLTVFQLPEKWRKDAQSNFAQQDSVAASGAIYTSFAMQGAGTSLKECADELEAALAKVPFEHPMSPDEWDKCYSEKRDVLTEEEQRLRRSELCAWNWMCRAQDAEKGLAELVRKVKEIRSDMRRYADFQLPEWDGQPSKAAIGVRQFEQELAAALKEAGVE